VGAERERRRDLAGSRTGFAWLATGPGGTRTSASASGGRCRRTTARMARARDYLPHDRRASLPLQAGTGNARRLGLAPLDEPATP
jgi:hypothetical protein